MKRFCTWLTVLTLTILLTTAAHADAIAGPIEIGLFLAYRYLPWVLVAAVVAVTAYLLWNMRKKK